MSLRHFIRLVQEGKRRGASSGEYAANSLATSALDCASSLDEEALAGFIEFTRLCHTHPNRSRDLFDTGHLPPSEPADAPDANEVICPQCLSHDPKCDYCGGRGHITKSSEKEWRRQNA